MALGLQNDGLAPRARQKWDKKFDSEKKAPSALLLVEKNFASPKWSRSYAHSCKLLFHVAVGKKAYQWWVSNLVLRRRNFETLKFNC